jgi:hypothetical protein
MTFKSEHFIRGTPVASFTLNPILFCRIDVFFFFQKNSISSKAERNRVTDISRTFMLCSFLN